jgi:hypothetical protein
MIQFKTSTGWAIPIKEFDPIQQKSLHARKYDNKVIKDLDKITVYYPEILFQNVARKNADGTIDLIIDSGAAMELNSGFLPKRYYKAVQVKKSKSLLGGNKWEHVKIWQVSEKEIVDSFDQSLSISSVEEVLEMLIKRNINYFGKVEASIIQ